MAGRRPGAIPASIAALVLLAGCARSETSAPAASAPAPWVSRAVPEARGDVVVAADGKRQAVRYRGWGSEDYGRFRTYAYGDPRPEPAPGKAAMPAAPGDPDKGRRLFLSRTLGPCTGCHLVRGDDVWPAGNVGPDLSSYGDRDLPDAYTFDLIYDPRHVFPNTLMPPWGTDGVLSPQDVVDLVAFLKTQKGPRPAEKDPERDPATRPRPVGFGDNLDPTNNPALLRTDGAEDRWAKKGSTGRACADCHPGGPAAGAARRQDVRAVPGARRECPRAAGAGGVDRAAAEAPQPERPAGRGEDLNA